MVEPGHGLGGRFLLFGLMLAVTVVQMAVARRSQVL